MCTALILFVVNSNTLSVKRTSKKKKGERNRDEGHEMKDCDSLTAPDIFGT